jgi:exonuclease SbcC
MITRIEITNFMSHAHTVLEPARGLTALIGPNNCGKSAVVAALKILATNENATYVTRHDTKECQVKVVTDDQHEIVWARKSAPRYLIDGQLYDRLGKGKTPPELQAALRLELVEITKESSTTTFDIHFGEQKSPIFLLDQSGAQCAQFFASSSDTILLLAMRDKHKEKTKTAQQTQQRLTVEAEQLQSELNRLEPVLNLNAGVQKLEQDYSAIQERQAQIAALEQLVGTLACQTETVRSMALVASALAPLIAPPSLTDVTALQALLAQWTAQNRIRERAAAGKACLKTLTPPPALEDTSPLKNLAEKLTRYERALDHGQRKLTSLARLFAPPEQNETAQLAEFCARLTVAKERLTRLTKRVERFKKMPQAPELANISELAKLIDNFSAAQHAIKRLTRAANCLTALHVPPQGQNLLPLRQVILDLEAARSRQIDSQKRVSRLQALLAPPALHSLEEIENAHDRLAKSTAAFEHFQKELAQTRSALAECEQEIQRWARTWKTCPTCGAALDPHRLLDRVASRIPGAHDHA